MSPYFPNPFRSFGGNMWKLIFQIILQKLKKKKKNLASLKTEVDKFDIDKLVSALLDLSKLSDVVKMMLLKKLLLIN